jgi:hypothetical protein
VPGQTATALSGVISLPDLVISSLRLTPPRPSSSTQPLDEEANKGITDSPARPSSTSTTTPGQLYSKVRPKPVEGLLGYLVWSKVDT